MLRWLFMLSQVVNLLSHRCQAYIFSKLCFWMCILMWNEWKFHHITNKWNASPYYVSEYAFSCWKSHWNLHNIVDMQLLSDFNIWVDRIRMDQMWQLRVHKTQQLLSHLAQLSHVSRLCGTSEFTRLNNNGHICHRRML